ncbi:GNAT family N-acetyltransferase [Inquilinus limosus]|uniref:GNAT family N-acetyltransferase n=1 Tax=Inquilinus limosus TaxID=171674 RepID=UPI003F15D0FE
MILRPAVPADAPALAALHVAVWRDTYRDLAPPEAAAALDVPRRQARWQAILADPAQIALVAEIDGALAGFGLAGPPGDPAFDDRAEVKYLYVGRGFARRGIGRRLLAALAAALATRGYAALGLGVVVGNDPAIAFYEAQGGRRIGAYTDPGPLWRSDNLLYGWDDLAALAARG